MNIVNELGDDINLIDPLWLDSYNTPKSLKEQMGKIKSSSALNILWQEELAVFRFCLSQYRHELFDSVDGIINCNHFLNNMMKAYVKAPMHVLHTPIDSKFYFPAKEKRPQIVAMGKIGIFKNTQQVVEIFKMLPKNIDKIYIGSIDMWGEKLPLPISKSDRITQSEMGNICDFYPALGKKDVADILSESWGYLNVSRYDTGCLSFLESAMSGCHCFCWDSHPMFDEYPFVKRFKGSSDGVDLITKTLKDNPGPNNSLRNHMVSVHGYEASVKRLKYLMSKIILG